MTFHSERARKANPVSLEKALGSVIQEIGFESNISLRRIKKNWEKIVGSPNARNTRPVALKKGILTVAVYSPVWMTQTRFYKTSFIRKTNSFFNNCDNTIFDIQFTLDNSPKE